MSIVSDVHSRVLFSYLTSIQKRELPLHWLLKTIREEDVLGQWTTSQQRKRKRTADDFQFERGQDVGFWKGIENQDGP